MTRPTDAIIVGAGIVGAACAHRLAQEGLLVTVVDHRGIATGTTAAGMGHIAVLDGSDLELALTSRSRALWETLSHQFPGDAAYNQCGTLWVAQSASELELAIQRAARMKSVGCEVINTARLAELEHRLRPNLPGGLLIPGDAIVRPPIAARWMLRQANARLIEASPVRQVTQGRVRLENGTELSAGVIILAAGLWLRELANLPLIAKKGHLLSIEGSVGFCKHQILEMGYLSNTHAAGASISFNIQPRAGGELVLGSSRQPGIETAEVEQPIIERILRRAVEFMPDLTTYRIAREWTGLRAASTDGLPIIGELSPGVFIAGGHEGLGLTMAPVTAELLADLILGRTPTIDTAPLSPRRFGTPR